MEKKYVMHFEGNTTVYLPIRNISHIIAPVGALENEEYTIYFTNGYQLTKNEGLSALLEQINQL